MKKLRLLLDANLSPKTAEFLTAVFGFDAKSLLKIGKSHFTDEQVIGLAVKQKRVIITLDLDYGQLYYFRQSKPNFGAVILRLKDQTPQNVNQILQRFFSSQKARVFQKRRHALAVVDEFNIRLV